MNTFLILMMGLAYFIILLMTPFMINYEDNNPIWKRVVMNLVNYGWGIFVGWITFAVLK